MTLAKKRDVFLKHSALANQVFMVFIHPQNSRCFLREGR